MKPWVKVGLNLAAALAILFGGFIIMIIVALFGGGNFYTTMIIIAAVVLLAFISSQIWGFPKPKKRYIVFAALAAAMLLSVVGYEVYQAYDRSLIMNEQGVDLTLYEPFKRNTKAASLEGESTLTLTDNLPKMDGATALYPLYSAFARAVYPEADYKVNIMKENDYVICTNTMGSYGRLIRGDADVIFAAGPSAEQLQEAKEAGVELTLTPIGREAFVFFVNARNPVNELSIEDIREIYSGTVTNWNAFGGKNAGIQAFQRPADSGSQTTLIKFMGDVPLMTPPQEEIVGGMGGIINRVSSYRNYENSIGYSFLFFATEMVQNNKIKLIPLNGVPPTRESVSNGTYPYASEFYAVTAGTQNPHVQELIDWILSEQGQYLVEQTGYTPINMN